MNLSYIGASTLTATAPTMQYGYDELDTLPDNPTSARDEPRRILSGSTLEAAKSSTTGAVLTR